MKPACTDVCMRVCLQQGQSHFKVVNGSVCVRLCVCTHALLCMLQREAHFPTLPTSLLWARPVKKDEGQRSTLFFSGSWPASALSYSVLNWTLTVCQKPVDVCYPPLPSKSPESLFKESWDVDPSSAKSEWFSKKGMHLMAKDCFLTLCNQINTSLWFMLLQILTMLG